MKKIVLIFSLLMTSACAHRQVVSQSSAELALLQRGQQQMKSQNYEQALKTFVQLNKTYPFSIYSAQAKLEEGKTHLKLGQYSEAANVLRDVSAATKINAPQIFAESLFFLGLAYEGMGDDVRATSALLDAERLGKNLDPTIAKAELPAKLSAIYVRHGHSKEAMIYLGKAEKGLESLKGIDPLYATKEYAAELFYRMGSVFTEDLTEQNVDNRIQSLKLVQIYLFKSMRLDVDPWSKSAQRVLLEGYRNFIFIFNNQKNLETKLQTGSELMALFEQAELFKSNQGIVEFKAEQEVFNYISSVKAKVAEEMYKPRTYVHETLESERLNGVRREGAVNVDTLLPEEEMTPIPLPPKVISEEDPNL